MKSCLVMCTQRKTLDFLWLYFCEVRFLAKFLVFNLLIENKQITQKASNALWQYVARRASTTTPLVHERFNSFLKY